MITLILANGALHLSPDLLKITQEVEYVIAADGGAKHCVKLKLVPDTIIGDLDSVSDDLLQSFKENGSNVLQFPVRKDATDLELAIDHAVDRGASKIYFAGLLGGRWDMSLSNILLLAQEKYKHVAISVLGEECSMHILHPGNNIYETGINQRASLLPLKGDAEQITLTGFQYPLSNYTIAFGSSIGVSNVTCQTKVEIDHTVGVLLLIFSQNIE